MDLPTLSPCRVVLSHMPALLCRVVSCRVVSCGVLSPMPALLCRVVLSRMPALLCRVVQIKATPSPGRSSGSTPGSEGGDMGASGDVPTSVLDLADGVLHVYQVAFDELKRQASVAAPSPLCGQYQIILQLVELVSLTYH